MSKKKCYTNSVHGEDCKNQARDAESQTQGRAEFARTNTLADRATAGPQPAREEVAVLEEARTKCSERSHVNDCLSFTELYYAANRENNTHKRHRQMTPKEYTTLAAMFGANLEALKDNKYRPDCIFKPHTPLYAMAAAVIDYMGGKDAPSKGKTMKEAFAGKDGKYIQDLLSVQKMSRRLFNRLKALGVESLGEIEAVDVAHNTVVLKGGNAVSADGLGTISLTELAGLLRKYGAK